MKLTDIEIIAYRSIVNQSININENCIGLVGLNESGKTNILNSIRLLDDAFIPTIKDKSKINSGLPEVRFGFKISEQLNEDFIRYCSKTLFESNQTLYPTILKELKILKYNAFRKLELENGEPKKAKRYRCEYEVELNNIYYRLKSGATIPADAIIAIDEKPIVINKTQLIKKEHIPEQLMQSYEVATEDYIKRIINPISCQFFEKQLPQIVYWEYNDQYLLPSDITYDDFIKDEDPYSNCAPLYNVITLSRRMNIKDTDNLIDKISEWKNDSSIRRKDAKIITEDINTYIKKIWNDFDQSIKIEFEESKITIHIHDPKSIAGNYYEMESRSQGFKTFISFMLTIAAEIETESLTNCVLLLDEPETHLHPSGVRFMRDELMKLSRDNFVFFATHSIFMIDRKNICRHIIVRKDSEITKIIVVDRNNFIQESVIYEALGTTVDEFSIRSRNIIFEGKMDLILFDYFIKQCMQKRGNIFLDYELHDAGGCKNIISFFKNKVIPKESEWLLILDNDSAGRNVLLEINKFSLDSLNIIYEYYSQNVGNELEDILPELIIKDAISRVEEKKGYKVTDGFVINPAKTISDNVKEYIHRNNIKSSDDFDSIFKEILINIINDKLDAIKETSISRRRVAFQDAFPKYYSSFLKNLFKSKGVRIEE